MPSPLQHVSSFIKTTLRYPLIDSTSTRAAELVQDSSIALPMLVRADQQTSGRGRGSNAWWSDDGSLLFTLALDPAPHRLARELEPRLALTMAVAIIEALAHLGFADPELGIRWPNDIEWNDRKLGGILPELVETAHGRRILIGVGLNVTTRLDLAPLDIQTMATSLERITGVQPDNDQIVTAILDKFPARLDQLATGDPRLPAAWQRLDLLMNRSIVVQQGSRIIAARARGITPQGELVIEHENQHITLQGGQILRHH